MKLDDHSPVDNICDITVEEKRYILFNSIIYIATICEIRSKECVVVRFNYLKKPFRATLSIRSIYKEKPPK